MGANVTPQSTHLERLAQLLANDPQAIPPRVVDTALSAAAHASLTAEQAALAWEDYSETVRLRDQLEAGLIDWQSIVPELTTPERRLAAYELLAERADDALGHLLHGQPAT